MGIPEHNAPFWQRRAVGSIVATVLTVVVALAASVAAGGFVFGVMGHAQNSAQVVVLSDASLYAADFSPLGTSTTFGCATSSSGSFLTLNNAGTASANVAFVYIDWAGSDYQLTPSGQCTIGALGSSNSTIYLVFPATSQMAPAPVPGERYSATVTLSTGAQLLLAGSWQ